MVQTLVDDGLRDDGPQDAGVLLVDVRKEGLEAQPYCVQVNVAQAGGKTSCEWVRRKVEVRWMMGW